jgi:citrate lyase subunit beta/citryl-CoA lyase
MATPASLPTPDPEITRAARERNEPIERAIAAETIDLEPRWLLQMAHLTCPATVWKYVEGAVTRSAANLVMLDLEDSIPRGDEALLAQGRANVVRALQTLDWGTRLRFFRPRGLALDPGHEDLAVIVAAAGAQLEGVVFPKVERAEEVASLDATLTALERKHGLPEGKIKLQVLIESVGAEERAFEIARASRRLTALIFGAFDYWSSLRMLGVPYRADHPLIDHARARIAKASASVGIPAIAEMTLNFPTRDKSEAERRAALEECRRDAERARAFGFRGKWTGIPAQTEIALEVFSLDEALITEALTHARAFLEAERQGRGAAIIGGQMADRATDRVHRVALQTAYALGRLDEATARELGLI